MGIYDRDYERNEGYGSYDRQPGLRLDGPRSLTTNIILLTFGVYLLQLFTQPSGPAIPGDSGWLTNYGSLHADVFRRPWLLFEFLTYGFLHDPNGFGHIFFNMLGFWIFGRYVEERYGKFEFLAFYLYSIIFAGLTWCLAQYAIYGTQLPISMFGASGGTTAVFLLFVLHNPRLEIHLMGVLPVPAWLLAIMWLVPDLMGAISRSGNVAYTAHLGGALFSYLYFRNGWRMSNWLPGNFSLPKFRRRTKLRIHEPEEVDQQDSEIDQRVNEILKKIQEQGQESLTWRERRFMEKASQEYQRRRR